jgi:hypothetical protein
MNSPESSHSSSPPSHPLPDSTLVSHQRNSRHARRWLRRWLLGALAVLLLLPGMLLGANYVWQNWLVAAVDPALARELTISRSRDGDSGENAGTASAEPLPGVLAGLSVEALAKAENPLDVVLAIADRALQHLQENVRDYECRMVSEVRLNDKVRDAQHMLCKIREKREGVPFAVYGKFLKPQSLNGQEVIWIEGQNNGNLVAHQAGLLNLTRWNLPPEGPIAMNGNKYPITSIGLENLLQLMIERGQRDRAYGSCEVDFDPDCEVNGRRCVLLEIRHPRQEGPYDFHLARIYFDIEQQLLFGYEGFDWPETEGGEPQLLERFFYSDIQLNPGLTAIDFDPDNPAYNYPGKKRD